MSTEVKGLDEVVAKLKKVYDRTGDMRPALAEVGNVFKNAITDSFERGSSPFGQVWAPLKRPRKSGGSKVLVDSGLLSGGFTVSPPTANSVEVGTKLKYAAVHQYGLHVGRYSKKGKKYELKIPARPFLPVDGSGNFEAKTVKEAEDIVTEYLTEVLG